MIWARAIDGARYANRCLLALFASSLALAAIPVASPLAQQATPYTVVESGRSYARLQDAVDAIGQGSGTIRFASFRFGDCAVQTGGDILYQAAQPGQAVLDGVACEGKAALVLRGRRARVEGLVFANMTVPDGNGAGIRLEQGDLAVTQAWFRDSQEGILTGNDEAPRSSSTSRPSPGSAPARAPAAAPMRSMSATMARSPLPAAGSRPGAAGITSRAGRRASSCRIAASTIRRAGRPTT